MPSNKISKSKLRVILILTLSGLGSPIAYFAYDTYQSSLNLALVDNPETVSANRYIASGAWPATKKNNSLITDFHYFTIPLNQNQIQIQIQKNSSGNKRSSDN
ncbi:hypothetical protein [Thalassotalea litorea]|uniref:hypothetical protein n=1 Tax=Thalassotalea litorea TaxID=2020715 RepID=UPI0037352081